MLLVLSVEERSIDPEDPAALRDVAQLAWAFALDTLHSGICLRFPSAHIALGSLQLALECLGVDLPRPHGENTSFRELFCTDLGVEDLPSIVSEILLMYESEDPSRGFPSIPEQPQAHGERSGERTASMDKTGSLSSRSSSSSAPSSPHSSQSSFSSQ